VSVPIRRIIPVRIIAVVKRVRNAPAPIWVPIPVVRIAAAAPVTATPPIAAPITASPVAAAPAAVFSRFAAAEFQRASAELAKMFAVFAMISAVSAVFAMSAVFCHSSAKGKGDGENDRKEHFHSTKVIRCWPLACVYPMVVAFTQEKGAYSVRFFLAELLKSGIGVRC
jgi:hypothetical protein